MKNQFKSLNDIDISKYREKKGRFDYLSWAIALRELKKIYPDSTFEVIKYDDKPYCKSETGYFVEVAVTVNEVKQSQIHPVLDNANRPITKPNCFQINTSIQRCLAKAIALHGLGLSLFAGEDLEQYDDQNSTKKEKETVKKASEKQVFVIKKNKLHEKPETLSSSEASALISEFMENKTDKPRIDKDKEIYEEYRLTIQGITSNETLTEVGKDLINQCPAQYREQLVKIGQKKRQELEEIPH